jgi:hypothetical protein
MIVPHTHQFAYAMRPRDDRPQYPFQMRDGYAALALSPALVALGYEYSTPIFNFPSDGPDLIEVDDSYLGENDVIVMTTRPPMHDHKVPEKKGFKRSFTTLEQKVFDALARSIETCTRVDFVLTARAAATSPEVNKRQSSAFRQNGGSSYRSYGSSVTREFVRVRTNDTRTAAFLIYEEHAWPGGPGLLAAFGMGGLETLVWCHRLATEFRHLLCTTPFVMAEMRPARLPERPDTMAFADAWEITILGPTQQSLSETG